MRKTGLKPYFAEVTENNQNKIEGICLTESASGINVSSMLSKTKRGKKNSALPTIMGIRPKGDDIRHIELIRKNLEKASGGKMDVLDAQVFRYALKRTVEVDQLEARAS